MWQHQEIIQTEDIQVINAFFIGITFGKRRNTVTIARFSKGWFCIKHGRIWSISSPENEDSIALCPAEVVLKIN